MLLFLIMLDSDEDRSKFVQLYHKYRYFLWYLACERLQDDHLDRKSTRLNSSHANESRMPSSA